MIHDVTHKKFLLIFYYTSYFGHEEFSNHRTVLYLWLFGNILSYFLMHWGVKILEL